jgi:hypothetical protein
MLSIAYWKGAPALSNAVSSVILQLFFYDDFYKNSVESKGSLLFAVVIRIKDNNQTTVNLIIKDNKG